MNPMPDIQLQREHIVFICRAMLSVARIDGIKPQEQALIEEFYRGAQGEGPDTVGFDALGKDEAPAAAESAPAGMSAEAKALAVMLCVMAGYADGHLSQNEWDYIRSLADGLGLQSDATEALAATVRDSLLSELALLPDAGSVARVAHELEELSS